MKIIQENKVFIFKSFVIFIFLLILVSGFDCMENGDGKADSLSTISITGHGEVNAVPDIANVSFSITKDAKTVKEAQSLVAEIQSKVLSSIKENGILEKDVKTTNASFYPKYEYRYQNKLMPCSEYGCPPSSGSNVIVGYTSSINISLKIRNTDSVGKIMEDLGKLGVSDLSGPNFSIDNEEGLKEEARRKAILEAKKQAKILARDLGVRLVKITSFSESGNYPRPMYAESMMKSDAVSSGPALAIPKGENTITSDVTITYKIR